MDQSKKQAITAIRKIAGTYGLDIVEMINASVISVDVNARTCVIQPLSGRASTQIENVGLMPERNDGEFKVPAIGSTVGVIISTQVDPYIVSWSDLQEWKIVIGTTIIDLISGTLTLGDGSFGGLVKLVDPNNPDGGVLARLNKLENLMNSLISLYNAHIHPTPSGPSSVTTSLETNTATVTTRGELENTSIKQGNG